MKFCFHFEKNSFRDLRNVLKHRCLMMSSVLKLFAFQSGESSGEESEYSRHSSPSRGNGNVEQFV
jgi:hypothetical protein